MTQFIGHSPIFPKTHMLLLINFLENGSYRNRENLQYKETSDSVLLSLFMRTNGKCSNSHAPSTGVNGYSALRQGPIFRKDQNMKKISTQYCFSVLFNTGGLLDVHCNSQFHFWLLNFVKHFWRVFLFGAIGGNKRNCQI